MIPNLNTDLHAYPRDRAMAGLALCRRIRSTSTMPIIMLTAMGEEKLVQMQLDELSPQIMVSARRQPVQTDRPIDRDQSRPASVANFIDNAIRYGMAARVRIERDVDRVLIIVDDDGPGIPADQAGVGLGLSVARTVAREHGGDVGLSNRSDGRLSAVIELPV